jgi:hypothetical protein
MEATRILYVINQGSGTADKNDIENFTRKLMNINETIYEIYLMSGSGNDDKFIRE